MELIIFIGIQATGKSEFYKQYFYKTHMRLNLDMLRTRHREKVLLQACIEARQALVIDNTNVTRKDREKYIQPARTAGFQVKGYYFQSAIADALARNELRQGKEKIPSVALFDAHAKLEAPRLDEGFDALTYVRIGEQGKFITEAYQDEI
jgi:predicted kinase